MIQRSWTIQSRSASYLAQRERRFWQRCRCLDPGYAASAAGRVSTHAASRLRTVAHAGASSTLVIRWGDPVQQILEVAREWRPDLIVTGQRIGLSPTRLLRRSISRQIRARSPCEVRIVRDSSK